MKPIKVKCWYVETRVTYPSGLDGWSRWQETEHHDRASAVDRLEEKIARGEKREMRIVALDFRGRMIPPERLPEGER